MALLKPCIVLCLAVSLSLTACEEAPPAEPERPPNIIYILADDAGYGDFGVYGQQRFDTPNIDRMAAEGMRFLQHYSGSTVCAPSRSVLMTGRHTGHTYIRGNKEIQPEGQEPLADSVDTLAELLQRAGYVTGAFGKWGLGFPGSEGDPVNQGFDAFYGYNCQRQAHTYYPRHLWHNEQKINLPGNTEDGTESYAHDLIQEELLAFIEAHRNEPFFLFVPYTIPHAELVAPDDSILAHYQAKFDEPNPFEGVDYGDPRFRDGPYASQPTPRAAFAAMMARMDLGVGQILDTLEELGLNDNTLVLFASDNGPGLEGGMDPDFFDSNGPFRGYKRDLYEGGIRVPFIARWPARIAPGTESDHVSAFWDVLPTLAEVAGAPAPDDIDGLSFLPTLTGQPDAQETHEYLYWEFHERGGRLAVRKGDWKAVQYDMAENPDAPIELYDLATDPAEEHNLADEHPDVVRDMARIMQEAHTPSPLFNFGQTAYQAG